jgi:hypothetical protein
LKAKSVALIEWNKVSTKHKFASDAYKAGFARAIELCKQRVLELEETESLSTKQIICAIENAQWKS